MGTATFSLLVSFSNSLFELSFRLAFRLLPSVFILATSFPCSFGVFGATVGKALALFCLLTQRARASTSTNRDEIESNTPATRVCPIFSIPAQPPNITCLGVFGHYVAHIEEWFLFQLFCFLYKRVTVRTHERKGCLSLRWRSSHLTGTIILTNLYPSSHNTTLTRIFLN